MLLLVFWLMLEVYVCDVFECGVKVFVYVVNFGYGVLFEIDFDVLMWIVEFVYECG